ncbi:MAG: hypothetical protein A2W66_00735 [Deltaproteobacteria bacterium RIFCSPLOWO2_02_56_12]|nr:MAG: hypothetical protein A2X89_05160 [Deltaproteobacteria bacterium GWD2_55_8]OGQ48868.1 MAG: hypothetical protein A2W66_00735 [Deltaproteobacteria bacterium RIFCSPLOWO2_02_56_12]OGQ72942.1 MAG: hypothetical protein A2W73_04610 [Deltaproteobacteria bacterium RIFCSPLOWO2_12_55_13]
MPTDTPEQRLHKTLLIFLGAFAVLGVPWAGWYYFQLGLIRPAVILFGYAAVSAIALIQFLITRRAALFQTVEVVLLLLVPFLIQGMAGGFAGSGAVIIWSILSPLCALMFYGARWSLPWFAAYLLLVFVSGIRDLLFVADSGPQSITTTVLFFVENLLIVSCILYMTMRYFIRERERAKAALDEEHSLLLKEQEKSERLLLNILPKPIADRLKAEAATIADGFSEVTILFADIVDFTGLSSHTSPEKLVELLNKVFSMFDQLAEKHGVEKIKTIGDAYMACAGLPVPCAGHAEVIAEMALDMCKALDEFNQERGPSLQIRVGMNSGPVVAGVIGTKKFIYDLWGDTVNTASRMESHGLAGRIQVTAESYALLRDNYTFEERAPLEVKGKGVMRTYLLTGRKVAA